MIQICKLLMTSLFCGHYLLLVHIEGTELPETSFLYHKSFNTFDICFCFLYTVHGQLSIKKRT